VDAVVFTAGVGERGPAIREKSLAGLEQLGITIDPLNNQLSRTRNAETVISTPDSPVKIFVIPTDEELVMTEDTYALLQGTYKVHTEFNYSFQKTDYRTKERAAALAEELAKNPELDGILASNP
jgi:acetate kinase